MIHNLYHNPSGFQTLCQKLMVHQKSEPLRDIWWSNKPWALHGVSANQKEISEVTWTETSVRHWYDHDITPKKTHLATCQQTWNWLIYCTCQRVVLSSVMLGDDEKTPNTFQDRLFWRLSPRFPVVPWPPAPSRSPYLPPSPTDYYLRCFPHLGTVTTRVFTFSVANSHQKNLNLPLASCGEHLQTIPTKGCHKPHRSQSDWAIRDDQDMWCSLHGISERTLLRWNVQQSADVQILWVGQKAAIPQGSGSKQPQPTASFRFVLPFWTSP